MSEEFKSKIAAKVAEMAKRAESPEAAPPVEPEASAIVPTSEVARRFGEKAAQGEIGVISIARARAKGIKQLNDDNLRQLIAQSMAIAEEDALSADAIGYMARILVQTTLPHSDPGNTLAWGRRNGSFSIMMQPGVRMGEAGPVSVGLPYGTYPRLLLTWITTEAVRTKNPRLELGVSLRKFMEQLGIQVNGKNAAKLRAQMLRLFSATVSWAYDNEQADIEAGIRPIEKRELWWDPKRPDQENLWSSYIDLNLRFFQEVVSRPVPIDMRALGELARERSPLGMDIYNWLTYRLSRLESPVFIPWNALEAQFGADYQRPRDFRVRFTRWLKVVLELYPKAKVSTSEKGLQLFPSPTHVPSRAFTP